MAHLPLAELQLLSMGGISFHQHVESCSHFTAGMLRPGDGGEPATHLHPLQQTVKRPRKVHLSTTKTTSGPGHQDSDEEDGPRRLEEAEHGQGYEGDTSSGSGRSWGERSRRTRTGHRSRAGSHGRRSPGSGSEANGLALVSGFKRLPQQDMQMRPVKSVLVRRRESDGEPRGHVVASQAWHPRKGATVLLLCGV